MKALMKTLLLIFVLLGSSINIMKCQITTTVGKLIYEDTLTFWPLHSWITLDTSQSNIWQIGKPSKEYFNSAYYGNRAILTDSTFSYSNNCNDTFYVTIPNDYQWGEGILSFYHKFDTDSLIDGGIIEVSYDNYTSWTNIIDDINHIRTNFIGLYEDTIHGGQYGFSGKSNNWQYVELYWHWIQLAKSTYSNPFSPKIRFRFLSDNINTKKEGWMIDGMIFRGYEIVPATSNIQQSILMVYPIPSNEYLIIEFGNENSEGLIFEIHDLSGRFVKSQIIIYNQICISDLKNGIYFYKIFKGKEIIKIGRFIKN